MIIDIADYDPNWKTIFREEQQKLLKALAGFHCCIDHIGSTSVEGLGAKPIIDILIGVPEVSCLDKCIEKILELDYIYVRKYEKAMPFRRFLMKGSWLKGTGRIKKVIDDNDEIPSREIFRRCFHIHMVGMEHPFRASHLAFRDHLRKNEADKKAYCQLKKKLAQMEWNNGDQFADAKGDFIRNILKQIGY